MVASIIILSIREIIMIKINSFSSFFVANWKLNGDFKFIDQFIENLRFLKIILNVLLFAQLQFI